MPLTRYTIRNENGLSDPDLYQTADRDDSEALLEAVSMSSLVSLLRQLGDLAQFAAEIFHDLHEEVMTTAARGHTLMARVQQLEAEVPLIEKAFLSQTDHSSFFTNSGVDWHPNLQKQLNVVTRGDLPRFIMDSYEECRGPPRLFLLDKFDVAGAGACLKRYTDPSFFKVEIPSSEIANIEVQRERKIRKVKKKGSRWRKGETPEAVPSSHAKLHQLLLEERIENGHSEPGHLVKLKRRQLNGSPFEEKTGKSYMEKILDIPTPEHKVPNEVAVIPALLQSTSDISSESAAEIHDIGSRSPRKEVLLEEDMTLSSPNRQELVPYHMIDELNVNSRDEVVVKVVDPISNCGTDELILVQRNNIEEELADDFDGQAEGSLVGDHSDEATSEVDNYLDALATMEYEMDTYNEYKPKNDQGFVIGKGGIDAQANFSDSQSVGNSSLSDDGNSLVKKGRAWLSFSDSLSSLAENMPSDVEGAAHIFSSEEKHADNSYLHLCAETSRTEFNEMVVDNGPSVHEDEINVSLESPSGSCTANSGHVLSSSVLITDHLTFPLAEPEVVKTPFECDRPNPVSSDVDKKGTNHVDSFVETPSDLSCTKIDEICVALLDGEKISPPHSVVSAPKENFPSSALPEVQLDSGVTLLPDESPHVMMHDDSVSEVDDATVAMGVDLETRSIIEKLCYDATSDVVSNEFGSSESRIAHSDDKSAPEEASVSGEQTHELFTKVDGIGEHVSADNVSNEDEVKYDDFAVDMAEADDETATAASASENVLNVDFSDVQSSHSGPEVSQLKELNDYEAVSSEHVLEPEAQNVEVTKQLEVLDHSNCKSDSDDYSQLDLVGHVHGPSLAENPRKYVDECDDIAESLPYSELSQQEVEAQPPFQSDSAMANVDGIEAEAPVEHTVELQADQQRESPTHGVVDDTDPKLSTVLTSYTGCHPEHGIPSELSNLLSDSVDSKLQQADEPNSNSFTQVVKMLNNIDQERHIDSASESCSVDSATRGYSPQSHGQDICGPELAGNPLHSGFLSFSLHPEATHTKVEDMPPLPPLPPMQWRMARAQLVHVMSQQDDSIPDYETLFPLQSLTSSMTDKLAFPALASGTDQPPEPILSLTISQSQMKNNLSQESVCLSSEPDPDVINDADIQNDRTASPSSFLVISETSRERNELGLPDIGDSRQSHFGMLSSEPSVKYPTDEHDKVTPQSLPSLHLNEVTSESGLEPTRAEHSSQDTVEQRHANEKSMVAAEVTNDLPHNDSLTSPEEIPWPPTSLALPLTYEAERAKGNKLPRPRNPLIDAVAAIDKNKLKKASERVRPEIAPKPDDRDSLLEQIRTKSFNLKPASAKRPSIKGIQGPKTNLKVAAILEKANAIRQALTGSDEDDDSDSWSDA